MINRTMETTPMDVKLDVKLYSRISPLGPLTKNLKIFRAFGFPLNIEDEEAIKCTRRHFRTVLAGFIGIALFLITIDGIFAYCVGLDKVEDFAARITSSSGLSSWDSGSKYVLFCAILLSPVVYIGLYANSGELLSKFLSTYHHAFQTMVTEGSEELIWNI